MNVQLTNLQRKQRALLVLPLLVVPLLTLAFWAMGGGQGENANPKEKSEGLNLQLPRPALGDDKDKTKLSFYETQEKASHGSMDSAADFPISQEAPLPGNAYTTAGKEGTIYDPTPAGSIPVDPNEQKVYQKLAELNKELAAQTTPAKKAKASLPARKASVETEDVSRLAGMMENVQGQKEPDPELAELSGMMDKILDIQHPDRVKEKIKDQSRQNKRRVYSVAGYQKEVTASLLGGGDKSDTTGLHNAFLDEKTSRDEEYSPVNAIAAVVQEDQVVTSGSTVKLRLLTDVFVGGLLISKGSFVFGTATLEEDRLKITVPSVRYKDNLFPVSLFVYDLDGLAGIHIPGSISREVVGQSAEQSLQGLGLVSLDPSLKAQAAAAGIQAAKGLLSRKMKLVKVVLKTGYRVLLRDGSAQE